MTKRPAPCFVERYRAPHPALRDRVAIYATLTAREVSGPRPWRVLPEGRGHVLLHVYADGREARLALVGPRSVYADIDRSGRRFTVIATLQADGIWTMFGLAPAELVDRAIPLREVVGAAADAIVERASAGISAAAACAMFDRWLPCAARSRALGRPLGHRAKGHRAKGPRAAAVAAGRIEAADGRIGPRTLAAQLGVSDRYLRRVMVEEIGLGPKRLARIARVRGALRAAVQGARPSRNWAALALDSGFADQSHLVHEFRALFGDAPQAFVARANREGV
ncbi:MAG: helix-turn-helix domain-containing protein [Planctomycetota bacterium]